MRLQIKTTFLLIYRACPYTAPLISQRCFNIFSTKDNQIIYIKNKKYLILHSHNSYVTMIGNHKYEIRKTVREKHAFRYHIQ